MLAIQLLNAVIAGFIGSFVGRFVGITGIFLPEILLEGCDQGREPSHIFKWFINSICLKCHRSIEWSKNIPIYWFFQPCCGFCNTKPDVKIFFLEIGFFFLFFATCLLFSFTIASIFVLCASTFLICCFITDYEYGLLPDQLTLSLVWLGLIGSLYPVFITPEEAISGAVFGYGFFWLFNALYHYFRKIEGMYPGDFKLNAGVGACVGVKWLIPILIASFILMILVNLAGVIATKKTTEVGQVYTDFLYKEVAYACFVSISTISVFYYILLSQS